MTSPSALLPDRLPRQTRLASLVSLAVTLLTVPASAEDVVELDWSAPAGCPDASVVRERIRSLVGGSLRTKERLRATGRIERRGSRYRLTLAVRDAGNVGERTVESDSCADLAGAAAVALGLLLENKRQEEEAAARTRTDTSAGGASSSAQKPAGSTAGAKDATEPEDATDSAPEDGAASEGDEGERHVHALVMLPLLTLDAGQLPAASYGVGAGLGVRFDAFRVVAIGRYYAPVTLTTPSFQAASTKIHRLSAELWTGYGWRNGDLELTPSVTGALHHYTARGAGTFVASRAARTVAVALGGGLIADLHLLDWLALTGSAALRVETSRPRFVIDDLGEERRMGQTGPVHASFALGLTGTL